MLPSAASGGLSLPKYGHWTPLSLVSGGLGEDAESRNNTGNFNTRRGNETTS